MAVADPPTPHPLPVGVLASGTGTNFEAIATAIAEHRLDAEVRVLICNRPGAAVLDKAAVHGVKAEVIDHEAFTSREDLDRAIVETLRAADVTLVVMAGYDRLVTSVLLRAFPERVINVHPALLPAFKGLDAQAQAVDYGARITGATVHLVDEQVDHGPIIVQAAVAVGADDDVESVRARVLAQEHRIYPYAIQLFSEDRIEVRGRSVRVRGAERAEERVVCSPSLPAGRAQRTRR